MRGSAPRRAALVLAPLIGIALAVASAAEPQAVGTVFAPRPSGFWLVNGAAAIDGGAVRDGAEVRLKDGTTSDERQRASIQVIYSVPYMNPVFCRGSDGCFGFRVVARGPVDNMVAKMSATGRLMHAGVMPELAGARGLAQEAVSDGVVSRDGDRISIAPLLAGVEPGSYEAVIAAQGATAITVPLSVSPKASIPSVVVPHAVDGLYTLVLRSRNGRDVLSGEAAFLAVAPDRFGMAKGAYDAAVTLTRTWSTSPRNAEMSTLFLRRVLAGLAQGD